jgi:hypothetical protein
VVKKITKPKNCDYCNNLVLIRYRIQYDHSQKWVMVCLNCWKLLAKENKFYRYGGTWKAK